MSNSIPLVVDLDGTLIMGDLLVESASQVATRRPADLLHFVPWLLESRVRLKSELARRCDIDPAALPYNEPLIEWLKGERESGRKIVLATASHQLLADRVAHHLGLFDQVLASSDDLNLKSERKRDRLVELFGERGFDYVGNDDADLPVWEAAGKAHIVSDNSRLINQLKQKGLSGQCFSPRTRPLTASLAKALRPHQWMKNMLIFVPLLAAHQYDNLPLIISAILAFIIFSLTASSVYLLNDLVDVQDDRYHKRKRFRPLASGNLSLLHGWMLWPILLLLSFILTWLLLPAAFMIALGCYFALTVAYSLRLKQSAVIDVIALAMLYTLRVIAGAAAVEVEPSFWLLSFSLFIFLSLALVKRFSELKDARESGREGLLRGRGYQHDDLEIVASLGSSAGYLSVLVLALYIQDSHTAELYSTPQLIWLACPLLLYWISRVWLLTHRGKMHDDPIVFAIRDRISWVVAICFVGTFAIARGIW
jgi:4-hydroxybenzoate polyprenyltransferase/phosphoserine phosphatase